MRFCVLASGSSANASLLTAGLVGVLIDFGLGPRSLSRRLKHVGASWRDIDAVLLTHVHGDHWNEKTLEYLLGEQAQLYCHESHAIRLRGLSPAFGLLESRGRVRFYDLNRQIALADGFTCRALPLNHDGGITCGFRFEGCSGWLRPSWALAYAADLGSWNASLVDALANVDVLALEFNHDEAMQRNSGRVWSLVRRVLSDRGHLSNRQAAQLVAKVLARSTDRPLHHLVQLHLSRDCNHPDLARAAARRVVREFLSAAQIHNAEQGRPGPWLAPIGELLFHTRRRTNRHRTASSGSLRQPLLPGWE